MAETYFVCNSCGKYYTGIETFFDYKGYRIKGCPKCWKIDGLKQISRDDFIILKELAKNKR